MDNADELRRRLVQIADDIRALAPDAFAQKHELHNEADRLRRELASEVGDAADAASAQWAQRAARKGTHASDDDQRLAQARIVSPIEGGGGGDGC